MMPASKGFTSRASRRVLRRTIVAASLVAILFLGSRVAAQTPTNEELNRRLSRVEALTNQNDWFRWAALGAAAASALAWFLINRRREETHRQELNAKKIVELLEASTKHMYAVAAVVRTLNPAAGDPMMTVDQAVTILEKTLDSVKKNA
jgi:hypothetical protein